MVPDATDPSLGTLNFTLDYSLMDDGMTFVYTVKEITDENDEGIVYDTHDETITVSVTDNGDGTMTATPVFDADGVTFENVKRVILNIEKSVAGNMGDRSQDFTFTLTLTENDAPYELTSMPGDWTQTAVGEYTFTLRHGQLTSVVLPAEVKYAISEDALGYTPAYTVVDINGRQIGKSDNAEDGWHYTAGAFSSDSGDQTVSFTNTLRAAVPTNARLTFGGLIAFPVAIAGLAVFFAERRKKRHVG